MSLNSITSRFSISLVANLLRGLLTILTTVFLARLLGTDEYGRIAFLLATFQAIRQLLDPGVSSAFFTFISQSNRSTRFMASYGLFLLTKYLLVISLVWWLMPEAWLNYAWRGESRDLLVFALSAVLMQFEWWPSIMQVLESQRRTALAQGLYLLLLGLQLMGVFVLQAFDILSIKGFMLMSAVLWASGSFMAMLRYHSRSDIQSQSTDELWLEKYLAYCLPLLSLGLLSFLVDFSDRWFLQTFAGTREQGYFSVSQQIAAVTLLITASMVRVLWKEIAEALHDGRTEQARLLYIKAKKGLFFISALIAAGLGPWSSDIVTLIFGPSYALAAPVFMVLIFASVYQTLGQIEGTLLMASGETGTGLLFNLLLTPLGIGLSFLLIAGTDGWDLLAFPSLGALGLAVKVLAVQFFSVNVLGYLLCQKLTWRFEWGYQIKVLFVLIFLGGAARIIFVGFFNYSIFSMLSAAIFYLAMVLSILVRFPQFLDVGFNISRMGMSR